MYMYPLKTKQVTFLNHTLQNDDETTVHSESTLSVKCVCIQKFLCANTFICKVKGMYVLCTESLQTLMCGPTHFSGVFLRPTVYT